MSTKLSSSKLLKDSEFGLSSNKLNEFTPIKEEPESFTSEVETSFKLKADKWKSLPKNSSQKEGYEQQEAELIGEGELTTVYKSTSVEGSGNPVIFKAFKLQGMPTNKKRKIARDLVKVIEKINDGLPSSWGLARYFDVDEDNASRDIVLIMEYIKYMNLK